MGVLVIDGIRVKQCRTCGETKSIDDFYPSGKYWQPDCKPCYSAARKAYYAANPDKQKTRMAAYRAANRDKVRERQAHHTRKWRYGVSRERFDEIMAAQGYRCPGCSTDLRATQVDVDHDHRCCSGESSCGGCVRGLLCHRCNVALAMVVDDPAVLRALADYLDR